MKTHRPKFCRGDAWFNQNVKYKSIAPGELCYFTLNASQDRKQKQKSTKQKAKGWPAFRKSPPTMLTLQQPPDGTQQISRSPE